VNDPSALRALGRRAEYRYDEPDAGVLEVFDNPHPGQSWVVCLRCYEFTSLCPLTGQPDFGQLHICYVPAKLCIESKSLKLYLMRYRNHGAFHEDCVNKVATDLAARLSPRYLTVYGDFNPRGGIAIRPLAVRKAPDLGPEEQLQCISLVAQLGQAAQPAGPWASGPLSPAGAH
jgi:7-cyano-7-deazaguanine reductase